MTQILQIASRTHLDGGTTSSALLWPTGYTAETNDVAIVHVTQTVSNSSITTPSGWTLLLRTQRSTTHVDHIYRRVLSSGAPPSTTFAVAVSSDLHKTVTIWRNVDSSTPEDVTTVATSGAAAVTFTGADIGVTTTPAAVIFTMASFEPSGTSYDILGVNLDATGAQGLIPFTAYDRHFPQAGAYHYQVLANSDQVTKTHDFIELELASGGSTAAGWIATTIALRPADPTQQPIPRSLVGAARQPPLRSFGQRVAGNDATHQVKFSVQFFDPTDDGGGTWSSGSDGDFWDLGTWGGTGRWVDLTSYVRGVTWTLGSDQPADRPRVATGTVDLNNSDARFSPWNTSSPYLENGEPLFHPGLLMRWGVTYLGSGGAPTSGKQLWLADFTGIIESIDEHSAQNVDGWVTITLVEPISTLATFNGLEQPEVGGGENLTSRVQRLLDDANWPYGLYLGTTSTAYASATLQGTVMAGERLAELYLSGDSAGMYVYGYPDGGIVMNNPAVSANVLEFSNDPAGSELPIPVDGIIPYADKSRVLNTAIAAFVEGNEQSVSDAASVSKYGRIDTGNGWPRRDLICQSNTTLVEILTDVIAARAFDDNGIASIEVDCDMDPAVMFWRLGALRLFANVTVRWVHPSGNELTQEGYVEGMTHRVTNPGGGQFKWTAQLSLARFAA